MLFEQILLAIKTVIRKNGIRTNVKSANVSNKLSEHCVDFNFKSRYEISMVTER
jgi:hypothetical protein